MLCLLKKEELQEKEKEEECKSRFFFSSRGAYVKLHYSDVIHSFDWKSAIEHNGGV